MVDRYENGSPFTRHFAPKMPGGRSLDMDQVLRLKVQDPCPEMKPDEISGPRRLSRCALKHSIQRPPSVALSVTFP